MSPFDATVMSVPPGSRSRSRNPGDELVKSRVHESPPFVVSKMEAPSRLVTVMKCCGPKTTVFPAYAKDPGRKPCDQPAPPFTLFQRWKSLRMKRCWESVVNASLKDSKDCSLIPGT